MIARRLHFMRHPVPQGAGRLNGHADVPLEPGGGGIALCLARARRLGALPVIASDLVRAQEPARAIASETGAPLHLDARWRELDFGAWDGCDPASLSPAALAAFHDDPDACPPPGGERWSALLGRVGAALAEIDGDALVVTHAGAIRAALCLLLSLDYRQAWGIDLPYAALVSLRVWPGAQDGSGPVAQLTGLVG